MRVSVSILNTALSFVCLHFLSSQTKPPGRGSLYPNSGFIFYGVPHDKKEALAEDGYFLNERGRSD